MSRAWRNFMYWQCNGLAELAAVFRLPDGRWMAEHPHAPLTVWVVARTPGLARLRLLKRVLRRAISEESR